MGAGNWESYTGKNRYFPLGAADQRVNPVFPGNNAFISAQKHRQFTAAAASQRGAGHHRLPFHSVLQNG